MHPRIDRRELISGLDVLERLKSVVLTNARWITAKTSNIISYPFDCKTLVEETKILCYIWISWEAENVQSVVETDDDDIFFIGDVLSIISC